MTEFEQDGGSGIVKAARRERELVKRAAGDELHDRAPGVVARHEERAAAIHPARPGGLDTPRALLKIDDP